MSLTRREFLSLAPLAALATYPVGFPLRALAQASAALGAPPVELSATRVRGFRDPLMDFQFLRIMGESIYGGAAVGECLGWAPRIADGVPATWTAAFAQLGQRLEADGRARRARGHRVSARDAFLRAANSYRAAEYYASFRDPQHQVLGLRSRAAFMAAMRLVDHEFTPIRLRVGTALLPAYFLKPRANVQPSATVLVVNGFDGTLEEDYFYAGRAALERGYNVLHFAGPGQMDTMRFYPNLSFIPDFERVVKAAVDYVLARADVDAQRVALVGYSMGGYFATRAAAFEPRLGAVIPDSPLIDLRAHMAASAGVDPDRLPDFGIDDLDSLPLPSSTKTTVEMMLMRFGQPGSFRQTFQVLRSFVVRDEDLARIKMPALALIAASEGSEPMAQFERFQAKVSRPVTSHVFTMEEGGDNHTQVGNPALANAVIFDWLDETFAGVKSR